MEGDGKGARRVPRDGGVPRGTGDTPGRFSSSARSLLSIIRSYHLFLGLGVFLALFPLWADRISRPLGIPLVMVMRLVGIYTIAAVGLNLLIGYAGQVSLGHAAFFGVGAYTSALLCLKAHFPPWLGIPAAVAVSAVLGFTVAPVLRLKGHYLAMATLGLGMVFFVFMREMTWLTGGNDGLRNIPALYLPGLAIGEGRDYLRKEYFFIWIIALLVLLFCHNLVRSRSGRAMLALHQSEVAAEVMGVDVSWEKIKAFVLSAALAGLAGGIFAHIQGYIDPNLFTIVLSIQLVTMVVVGGMESIWGAVAGAGVITFIPKVVEALPKWLGEVPHWLEKYSNYEGIIYGLILVLTMVFMPKGITRGLADMVRYRRSPFVNPWRKKALE
ncbi:MAG: branched-chain amino acid ABC transporter permease [Actinobacteria bacterium]|nr:branched-chain amino acid ABC transporter permease [Actinomycetota bacterium]